MTNYIKSLGYRFTTRDTLNPLEFRLIDLSVEPSEELSVMGKIRYNRTEVYELCLSKQGFSVDKVTQVLDGIVDLAELVTGSASIAEEERSYLITFTFIKEV